MGICASKADASAQTVEPPVTTNKDDVPSTSELTSKSGSLPPRAANLDLPPAEPVKAAAAENTNGASTTVELTPDQTSRSRLAAHVVTAADDDDSSGPVIVVDARVSAAGTSITPQPPTAARLAAISKAVQGARDKAADAWVGATAALLSPQKADSETDGDSYASATEHPEHPKDPIVPEPVPNVQGSAPGSAPGSGRAGAVETSTISPGDVQVDAGAADSSAAESANSSRGAKGQLSAYQRSMAPELVAVWEEAQNFTEEQNATMEEFRAELVKEGLMQEWMNNKPTWYRFCQARGWEVAKALVMIKDTLAWRKEMGMDYVDTEHGPTPRFLIDFVYPELAEVKKCYHFSHHKTDKNGMPVYFDRLGDLNYSAMIAIEGSTPDRVLKYFTWYAEATWFYRLPAASLKCGRYVGKGLYVMDLSGFALSKHFTKETRTFIQAFIKTASDNYPETIYKTYIINAPMLFRTAWAFVSNLLDARQKAKFSILGGPREYLPKLLEVMDKEDIPVQFGGTDTSCNFYEEQGPWQELMPSKAGPRVK
jgi:hypothetical protein